jgi:hypothetical protein
MALALVSTPAWATPSARLVYSRTVEAASCPAESELRTAVATRLGYDPFFPWAKQAVIVQILRQRSRYIARVLLLDEQGISHGAREFSSDQRACAEIFDAVALAISIAVDAASKSNPSSEPPDAPSAPPASSPPASPPAPAPPAELPPAATPGPPSEAHSTAPAAASTPRVHVDVGIDALGSTGMVPSASPGVSAFARGRVDSWSLSIEVRADLAESYPRSTALGGGSVEAWLPAAGLAPCFHVRYVAACALGLLGSLQASGQHIDPRSSRTTSFIAAGVRLGVEWPESTMVALRVHLDGLANLHRARLILGQSDEVWSAPPMAGTVGAGVVVRFP